MAFSADENPFNSMRMKKRSRALDLNASPQVPSYGKEVDLIESLVPGISSICSKGLRTSINMVEEALAKIPLSFKKQENSKSVLVIDNGILTLVQRPANVEPQPMHKRGLRTSWTMDYVDGSFELPTQFVKYIAKRDKYRQRLSKLVTKKNLNIEAQSCNFSVYSRLEGWKVETRKRPDKTHDKFYHHRSSRRLFRSLVEVEKFIKYEIYPPKPQRRSKMHSSV